MSRPDNGILDLRGLRCPWPALRAAAAMTRASDLTILVDDPAAPEEIATVATARSWSFSREINGRIRIRLSQDNESLSANHL